MGISSALAKTASKLTSFGANLARASFGLGVPSESPLSKGRVIPQSTTEESNLQSANQALGLIYRLMVRNQEDEKLFLEKENNHEEEQNQLKEKRNNELLKALTVRRAPAVTRQAKKKEVKPTEPTKKVKVKKEEVKTTEKVPVKKAPRPTAEKAPTAPTAPSAPTPSAAKIAIGAAVGAAGVFASADAFSKTMMPFAEQASKKLGGKIPPVAILGQWAGESSNGKSVSAPFNYAGIKAGKTDKKGDYVLTEERYTDAQIKQAEASGETLQKVLGPNDTITKKGRQVTVDEWYGKGSVAKAQSEGKNWVQVKTYFAKFDSPEEFADRYVQLLSSPRYAKARESTSPSSFGLEVAKAGYATASADKYSAGIQDYASRYKPALVSESSSTVGNQIDTSSKENVELKTTLKDKQDINVTNTTLVSQTDKSKVQPTPDKIDDSPIIIKKSRK